MIPVPNQPILFTNADNDDSFCCVDSRWKQRMFNNDEIYFQFELDVCIDKGNILSNPEFTSTSDWTLSAGGFISPPQAFVAIDGTISQTGITTTTGALYEIEIDLFTLPTAPQSTVTVSGFQDNVTFEAVTGPIKVYGVATSPSTTLIISFNTPNPPAVGFYGLNYVLMSPVDGPSATIVDENGNTLDTVSTGIIETTGLDTSYITFGYSPNTAAINNGGFYIEVERSCAGDSEQWTSEWICVIEPNDCDLLIGGCSEVNYDSQEFLPVARLQGELIKGSSYSYPNRFSYQDNVGRFRNAYTRRNKKYMIKLELVPEHIRDFIYSLPLMNEIGLREGQNTQYYFYCEDEPDEPSFPDSEKNLSNIMLEVVRSEQNEVHRFIAGCSGGIPPLVIGEREINQAIATDTTELINAQSG